VPIALDEELIGLRSLDEKRDLVEAIMPQYLILKPSLLGGFRQAQEWIEVANECGLHWWATSALESNLGLNAIAQWVYTQQNPMPQGLGTGQLYRNNLQSPLHLDGPALRFNPDLPWVWPQ
jgi:O-succinylbenzoate synthase